MEYVLIVVLSLIVLGLLYVVNKLEDSVNMLYHRCNRFENALDCIREIIKLNETKELKKTKKC